MQKSYFKNTFPYIFLEIDSYLDTGSRFALSSTCKEAKSLLAERVRASKLEKAESIFNRLCTRVSSLKETDDYFVHSFLEVFFDLICSKVPSDYLLKVIKYTDTDTTSTLYIKKLARFLAEPKSFEVEMEFKELANLYNNNNDNYYILQSALIIFFASAEMLEKTKPTFILNIFMRRILDTLHLLNPHCSDLDDKHLFKALSVISIYYGGEELLAAKLAQHVYIQIIEPLIKKGGDSEERVMIAFRNATNDRICINDKLPETLIKAFEKYCKR